MLAMVPASAPVQAPTTPEQARSIAKDAYTFTHPLVMNYRTMGIGSARIPIETRRRVDGKGKWTEPR
jgi:hypothetical protein